MVDITGPKTKSASFYFTAPDTSDKAGFAVERRRSSMGAIMSDSQDNEKVQEHMVDITGKKKNVR